MEGEGINGQHTYTPLDLFDFESPGELALSPRGGYFSIDNGATPLGVSRFRRLWTGRQTTMEATAAVCLRPALLWSFSPRLSPAIDLRRARRRRRSTVYSSPWTLKRSRLTLTGSCYWPMPSTIAAVSLRRSLSPSRARTAVAAWAQSPKIGHSSVLALILPPALKGARHGCGRDAGELCKLDRCQSFALHLVVTL
jgi:hypothetical protein